MSGRSYCERTAAVTPPSEAVSRAGLVAVHAVRSGQVVADYHNVETVLGGVSVGAVVSPEEAAQRLAASK